MNISNMNNIESRVQSYWTKRAHNFNIVRKNELNSSISERWREEIVHFLPEGKVLQILDVGTGTGYFAILLSQSGHQVTGIDLTDAMLKEARDNAALYQVHPTFQQMDAQKLAFWDQSFDVVISRNLTWTLPNAEHAYGEWMRVLKTGGVLLNFDANYGKEDVADTKGLPEAHAHFKVGNEMLEECERIKLQLPISRKNRPAYDVAVLCENTAGEIRIDTSLGKRIYLEKDEFYNPAPMFSICAVKQ